VSETDNLTPLDFLAMLIYKQGRPEGLHPRWLCLREELRREASFKAQEIYQHWRGEELRMKKQRDGAERRALKGWSSEKAGRE